MRWFIPLCLLAATGPAQDGGRDTGRTGRSILFVRMERTDESAAIYRAAWRALEPHFVGEINRRRLADFDGDPARAKRFFATHPETVLVVALDHESARVARERKAPVLEVSPAKSAQVRTRVDREGLARLLRQFNPGAKAVAILGGATEELPGFRTALEPAGCDLAWLPEGGAFDRRPALPLVSTRVAALPTGVTLTVRPDPTVAGLKVAGQVLRKLRDKKEFRQQTVARLRVAVDLGAARDVDYEVPLKLLARADIVRRAQ